MQSLTVGYEERKSNMKVYGVALIGCGQMGETHLEHIYVKDNVKIACVCDVDITRAEYCAKKYNAGAVETDAGRCIERADVDVVIIATYPSTHLWLLKECIKHKKHVICEKPITDTLENGMEFVRLVKENPDIKVLIGHILRHNETYCTVAKMIKSGMIGFPIIMRMTQNHHTMNWNRYLRLIHETSPIIDCGVHYFDVMRWFTGAEITSVSGVGMSTENDVPEGKNNYEMATVKMSDGSVAFYEAGWTNAITASNMKEFVGPCGSIRLIYRKDREEHREEGDLIEYYSVKDKKYNEINIMAERKPTDIQFDCLVDMIENGSEASPTIDDVYKSFYAAIQAETAINTGTVRKL